MNTKTVTLITTLLCLCVVGFANEPSTRPLNPDREKVKPLFDFPMRDTHVLRVDKTYYMTGTLSKDNQGKDFQNNAGVRLWKSSDLKTWDDCGLVWDIDKDSEKSPKSDWQKVSRMDRGNPSGPLVRGITAPEILYIKNNYYITYSMNGHGCGLLKSSSGKPEGPYEDLGQMVTSGGDASMFEDKDGSVYFIWGQGAIAQMNDSLTKVSGTPRLLLTPVTFDQEAKEMFFGTVGGDPVRPHGFRVQRYQPKGKPEQYLITFAAESCRYGRSLYETFTLHGEKLNGPFGFPRLAVSNGGQSTLFEDGNGNWYGAFYGADSYSTFRDRPGLVPLKPNHHGDLTNRRQNFFTEMGPWDTIPFCRPELRMNDAMILAAPDGYYYLAGSNWMPEFFNQVMLYRSKDLKTWTRHKIFDFIDIPWVKKVKERYPEFLELKSNGRSAKGGGTPWSEEIHYLNGKFYVVFLILVNGASREIQEYVQEVTGDQGRSTIIASDKGLGPYKYVSSIGVSMPSFMQDDDPPSSTDSGATGGTIYMTMGRPRKMKPDMTGFLDERKANPEEMQKEGLFMSYDPIGSYMLKIGGKYIYGTENLYGGYDGQYWVGDSPTGPWSRPRVHMPHGGHAGMFKSHDPAGSGTGGKYYAVMWHAFKKFSPTAVPLHVEVTKDDVIIMPEYEWEHRQKESSQ